MIYTIEDWRNMYITVKQAAEKWGISDRRVRILCSEEKPDA